MSHQEIKNNKMVSMGDFLSWLNEEKIHLEIPMYQRNYVWDTDTAKTLLTDLWDAFQKKKEIYTIGMLSLSEKNDTHQNPISGHYLLVDGQQRSITLTMLFVFLSGYPLDGQGENLFHLSFARDKGLNEEHTRLRFLLKPHQSKETVTSLDKQRFYNNLQAMKEVWEDKTSNLDSECQAACREKFSQYIKGNCQILFHCTELEALNEFLNINNNKTRFAVSDHIKAQLIIESGADSITQRQDMGNLFRDLSRYFYHQDNQDIREMLMAKRADWDQPATDYKGCNRLSILYLDRKIPIDEKNYRSLFQYDKEKEMLCYLSTLMNQLRCDLDDGDDSAYLLYLGCLYTRWSWVELVDVMDENQPDARKLSCLEEHYLSGWKNLSPTLKQQFIACIQLTNKEELPGFLNAVYKAQGKVNDEVQGTGVKLMPEIPTKGKGNEWILEVTEAEDKWFEDVYCEFIENKYKHKGSA